MKYRKKPVVIEAIQFTNDNLEEIEAFIDTQIAVGLNTNGSVTRIIIPTLEGNMIATIGDYIIRGIKGEYYPCKSDIFESTYEIVEESK